MSIKVHWENPWIEAVPVPIEELAEMIAGGSIMTKRGIGPYDKAYLLKHWGQSDRTKLDAYLLPDKSHISAGVRYGPSGEQYVSPMIASQAKAKALLDKYSRE